jgi:hypothetical protein
MPSEASLDAYLNDLGVSPWQPSGTRPSPARISSASSRFHGLSPIIPSPECFQISPFCVTTAAMGL